MFYSFSILKMQFLDKTSVKGGLPLLALRGNNKDFAKLANFLAHRVTG